MNHSYKVKDMSCGMGLRRRYEPENRARIIAEICREAVEEVSNS